MKQFTLSKIKSMFRSDFANDGKLLSGGWFSANIYPWWYLELGANVRVSMVFILHFSIGYYEGFDILVGECFLSKVLCIFSLLLLFGSLFS